MAARLAGSSMGRNASWATSPTNFVRPLARAQVALGILEQQMGAGSLADLREEVQQMSGLVNELLSFSRASLAAGRIKLETRPAA